MNLVERLIKISLPLIILGSLLPFSFGNSQSLYSPGRTFWSNEREISKKIQPTKLALALITRYDPPQASKGMEEMLKSNFYEIPDYVLYTERTNRTSDLTNFIEIYSKEKPIDALILAYHGERYSFLTTSYEGIDTSNVEKIFSKYSDSFSKDAIIILYSCSTGKGEDNIAKRLSDALNRDVIAPNSGLIPETYLEPWQRIKEFALDENGRIAFDYNNFKRYGEPLWRWFSNSISTYSYKIFKAKKVIGENGKECFFFSDKNPE